MKQIIFPLKQQMQGPTVLDLQDGLLFLLDRGLLLRENEGARRELAAALKKERERQTFAGVTSKLVGTFQKEHGLQTTGEVDERTAVTLNSVIPQEDDSAPEFQYVVRGQVLYRGGRTLQLALTRPMRTATLKSTSTPIGSRRLPGFSMTARPMCSCASSTCRKERSAVRSFLSNHQPVSRPSEWSSSACGSMVGPRRSGPSMSNWRRN